MLAIGCTHKPLTELGDAAPSVSLDPSSIKDAVPRVEPKSRIGNKFGNKNSYEVLGKSYQVMDSAQGYVEEGRASWYGTKFQGRRTSNWEIFDTLGMTAAHKNLPLPTYVKVTNLENQKQVIVRVNDRGPFHGERIIDLSYAAAVKLGYHKQGTAQVRVEAIDPRQYESDQINKQAHLATKASEEMSLSNKLSSEASSKSPPVQRSLPIVDRLYLQVGAFGKLGSAQTMKSKVEGILDTPVIVVANNTIVNESSVPVLHRVRIGPFANTQHLERVKSQLIEADITGAMLVTE